MAKFIEDNTDNNDESTDNIDEYFDNIDNIIDNIDESIDENIGDKIVLMTKSDLNFLPFK